MAGRRFVPPLRFLTPVSNPPARPISFEMFRAALNSRFRAATPAGMELELIQAVAGRNSPARLGSQTFETFSLIFSGPETPMLDQAIHILEHEQLGQVQLFLVPIANVGGSIHYEAVFNRLVAGS